MHQILLDISHWLGISDEGTFYNFWSGIGGYLTVVIPGIVGFFKLKKQREHHHEQLKRHIDYKFSKLTDEKVE